MLNKLASGLGVPVDGLLCPIDYFPCPDFDDTTNAMIAGVVAKHPDMFDGWTKADFELYNQLVTE